MRAQKLLDHSLNLINQEQNELHSCKAHSAVQKDTKNFPETNEDKRDRPKVFFKVGENFPNWVKNINLQIQEGEQTPTRINSRDLYRPHYAHASEREKCLTSAKEMTPHWQENNNLNDWIHQNPLMARESTTFLNSPKKTTVDPKFSIWWSYPWGMEEKLRHFKKKENYENLSPADLPTEQLKKAL